VPAAPFAVLKKLLWILNINVIKYRLKLNLK